MRNVLIILAFFSFYLRAEVINFSPLPQDKAPKLFSQYLPMLKYLEKETGHKFNFHYSTSYEDLIKNFSTGKLNIIELGPLPYIKLKEKNSSAQAFLTFLNNKGEDTFTCNLLTKDKNLHSFSDITKNIKVKLSRKASTCAYFMTNYIFKKNNKSLKNFKYEYVETDSNVLLSLLMENETVGSVNSSIAQEYSHFNFHNILSSNKLPGFAFVANTKKISDKTIKDIQNALMKLKPLTNKKDAKIVKKWSQNIKYGSIKTKENSYKNIYNVVNKIKLQ